ncbi:acyl-CoA dehydratase activase [Clostridium aminobutyricum]|uniref:2-hydroxyglutaryl-CoA dehydratase n=1 Tax=Clostridium aminobutyricum TaxID=33953 RepID=A0A939DAH3_CLOAM|nr:acyl-CoA dehydratase activase [Clostridium aminobutyricum]MBN7774110.1 2-hydroxyglutaryl-CoA dehydratase [Clostridium aminobutyricum]
MFLGIDIGSSSSKAAILNEHGELLSQKVVNLGTGTKGIEMVLTQVFEETHLQMQDIHYSVVTGYGRMTYAKADLQITEITCHAKGVFYLYPNARSIIDIGGQDAKAIKLSPDGKVENFQMNEKCAAGTGRFFEVMARVLNCKIDELAELAAQSEESVPISSVCTVFAESEVISQLASGATPQAVAKGAHQSVAKRVAGLCNRVGLAPDVIMTGGVALNYSLVKSLEEEIGLPIIIPESPQTMGALGAAVFAREKYISNSKL